MRRNYFFLIFLLFLISCNFSSNENKEWKKHVEAIINSWKGKTIILPDTLMVVDKDNSLQKRCLREFQSKFKIVTFIDASCSACLNNFSYWEAFIDESKLKRCDCDFLVFVNIDKLEWMDIRSLKFTYPFIIDSTCQFVEKNCIYDKRFQTFLVNEKNEVIVIGDPTVNKELGILYKDILFNSTNYQL